jgi:V/A-type H+-transporting ATPase subunit E
MADQDLKQLINALKTEGIEAAEAEAQAILAEAKRQAAAVEEAAQKRKKEILATAEQEAADTVNKGKQALQQAARDLKLALRQEIVALLDTVFQQEVSQHFTPDLIQATIIPILENVGKDVVVEVPAEQVDALREYLRQKLQDGQSDLVLKPNGKQSATSVEIRHTSDGWKYELSPETITEALRPHLTQRWLDSLGQNA